MLSKQTPLPITNFYEHIKHEDNALRHYPNESKMNIPLPARILCVGTSGSMKTNCILNLARDIGIWDKVVILAKNLEEPLYKHMIEAYRKLEKKHKIMIILAITDITDLPTVNDFDPKENTLLICDDFICEKESSLAKLTEIFIRGRKNGVTSVFISQSYFRTPMLIRQNVNQIIMKKLSSVKDLGRIMSEYALGETPEEIMQKYKKAVAGAPQNFFLIDVITNNEELRYRKNWAPFSWYE